MLRVVVLLQANVFTFLLFNKLGRTSVWVFFPEIIQKVANKWKAAEVLEYHE